jgi:phage terminase large subunit GpA-like protein
VVAVHPLPEAVTDREARARRYCHARLRAAAAPERRWAIDEWARENVRLSTVSSSDPGPYLVSRTPYLRELFHALSADSPTVKVSFLKGSRIGVSQAARVWMAYRIATAPVPIMYVLPTVDIAKDFSKTTLKDLIAQTAALREKIKEPRARDSGNTIRLKEFPGGFLALRGANSSAGLSEITIVLMVLDEVDQFEPDLQNQGDPCELAERRLGASRGRKLLRIGNPTDEGSRIAAFFAGGTRERYHLPCPHCGGWFVLRWTDERGFKGFRWEDGRPETAHAVCPHCAKRHGLGDREPAPPELRITERHKRRMLDRGVWIPDEDEPDRVPLLPPGEPLAALLPAATREDLLAHPRVTAARVAYERSFHLPMFYSAFEPAAWPILVREWIEKHRDRAKLKAIVNTVFGEVWTEQGSKSPSVDSLLARREAFPTAEEVPAGVCVLVAFCDVQEDRLECAIRGFGRDEESWLIGHFVIWGDTSVPPGAAGKAARNVWDDLDELLLRRWRHPSGHVLGIEAAGVDTGYRAETVYKFCTPRFGRNVWATKGQGGQGRVIWPVKPSRKTRGKHPVWIVGVDAAKEIVYARLRNETPGPGFMHFPAGLDASYFRQLRAEYPQVRGPKRTWEKNAGARNEAFDCEVGCVVVLAGLAKRGMQLNERARRMGPGPAAKVTAERKPTPEAPPRPAGDDGKPWIDPSRADKWRFPRR